MVDSPSRPRERLVFVTGLSGSGKSAAMNCFEDMGFFCSDNVPTVLLEDLVRVLRERAESVPQVAIVVDVRERDFLSQFVPVLKRLREGDGPRAELVYLEASDEVLLRRFSETKRPHPLALDRSAADGLREERELLEELRDAADMIIDTTNFNHYQLRDHLQTVFQVGNKLVVSVKSFGFKYGVPLDADLVFDVRFLKNPYYVPELKPRTGEDEEVDAYVFEDVDARTFFASLEGFVKPLIPRYIREGKAYLNIAIGCTGGRHRSVAVSIRLAKALRDPAWAVNLEHRDARK
ncbi:MAG: RNase adapter RapZ [Planctomycetota bacterium JB042]